MSNLKTLKKGEFLFKEGDKINSLFLIQSGSASLCLLRNKKTIDLFPVGSPQVLGELGIAGANSHPYSAYATSETKYIEFPLDGAKGQIEAVPQFIKILIKSLLDRAKAGVTELKSSKMEKDSTPCPDDQVAKIFGSLYHTVHHKGTIDPKEPNKAVIDWTLMKQYAQRMFSESPRRLEQACNILVKMKLANYVMGKPIDDPEGPDEIQKFELFDLAAVEAFFEFYQYHYFKGGKGDILKVDESCYNLVTMFLKLVEGMAPDRFGVVTMDYSKVLEAFKTDFNFNLNNGHFTVLEGRGVFAKRQARNDGNVALAIELKEWQNTQKIWRIIKEIEKWNEKGFVDIHEEEAKAKKKASEFSCPQCQAEHAPTAKFCAECGYKLEAKAPAPGADGAKDPDKKAS